MLMVYLPKEKLLIEADAYTPRAEHGPAESPSPFNVSLAENVKTQGLAVDQIFRCTAASFRSRSSTRPRRHA